MGEGKPLPPSLICLFLESLETLEIGFFLKANRVKKCPIKDYNIQKMYLRYKSFCFLAV